MKLLKKSLFFLIGLSFLLFLAYWFIGKSLSPNYNGELKLSGLNEKVTVYYDDNGVPHITAENNEDALRAFGYVHAQDRLWQMELIRRLAAGRLAEIFGKDLVGVDKLFSGLGIEEAAEKSITELNTDSEAFKLTMAYLDGVNQFIENGPTPLEYYLVGVEKEKYSIKDIYNVFGYMAFSFAAAHKTDPILTEVKEKYGENHLRELISSYSKNLTINRTQKNKEIKATMASAMNKIYEKLPVSPFIGSNSWVLAPQKTENGKVILANDPHIGFSQPSVWYQSHIKTPTYEMYGFNLALTPFPLLGHNREYAYGLTMLANDDIDFYIEENNPDNSLEYKTENGFRSYELVDKKIKVKDDQDITYQIKVSRHGPIMNDIIDHINDSRPIAMQWIYTKLPNKLLLDVSYDLSHASSLESFKGGAAKVHAPGLNIMYGDARGNVGWFSSAKLYQVRDSLFRQTYLDGTTGKDEIVSFINFDENPKAINPDWNYVYSANQQIDTVRGKLYPGYYQPQDRAKRIVDILESRDKFSKEDMKAMIFDITSSTASTIIKDMLVDVDVNNLSPSEKKAYELVSKWDGSYKMNSIEATIYNRLLFEFYKATYQDELGKSFNMFINTQTAKKILAEQVKRKESFWWDNLKTKNIESRSDIVNAVFKNTISFLQNQLGENVDNWTWNRVFSVEHEHAIGKAGGILRKIFNVGPFETVGGNEVLNNQIFNLDSTGYYKVKSGPSTRRVVDFSDIENSVAVLPTGQSGNVFSPYYKNQASKYVNGEFVKMKLNQEEIEQSKNKLILLPK
ncbi:penicillin acylase family protein [Tenacibaculum sp. SZ-18]|uniref:penicillin acylase family protein n=1 Tax=Tenacibaculum sp. SZ-18 TaxID=754423 RepID=UPI000C2D5A26|nr:penicillin acylase family protein [Tenacibaculum sp. SZ-18]AUC14036.1 penicillin acylase family protein [Tenacibaculum sp. SZ-18]